MTIFLFLGMRYLYNKFPKAYLHPVLTSTIIIIGFLLILNIPYERYMLGGVWIEKLLGPCIVALAYPLYNQRELVRKHMKTILLSVFAGITTAMISVVLFAKLLQVENETVYSVLPKSITTPVAIQISETIGGIPSLTAAFVMVAGFSGVILGPIIMKYTHINSPLSKGLALGSASHALGAAKAAEYGEVSLSMASVSMTLSAIVGSIIGPLIVLFL